MFAVEFYEYSKRINSTSRPRGQGVLIKNGDVVEPLSMFRPVIRFDLSDVATYKPSDDELPNEEFTIKMNRWNYMYIRQFRRFYYISEWTYEMGFWIATGREDTLASWRDFIGNTSQYILRSNMKFDGSIMDHLYPSTSNVTRYSNKIDIGFFNEFSTTTGNYVIGVLNKSGTPSIGGAVRYYRLSASNLAMLLSYLMSDSIFQTLPEFILTTQRGESSNYTTNIKEFLNKELLKYQFNPLQYIVSCKWYPFSLSNLAGISEIISCGFWQTDAVGTVLTSTNFTVSKSVAVPKHPQSDTRGSYLNLSPYSRYELVAGSLGTQAIDSVSLSGIGSLDIDVTIDVVSGVAQLQAKTPSHTDVSNIVAQLRGGVAVDIPLAQYATNYVGGTLTAVGNAVSAAAKAFTGDIGGAIMNGFSGIASTIESFLPQVSQQGSGGDSSWIGMPWCLTSEHVNLVEENNDHLGRPLCKTEVVKDLGGYMVVMDADIHFPATDQEMTEIKSYMEGGFWYQ